MNVMHIVLIITRALIPKKLRSLKKDHDDSFKPCVNIIYINI